MSLNAATIEILLSKGLSGDDLLEVARAMEIKRDPTAADRKQRQRDKEKSRRDVTRDTLKEETSNPLEPQSDKSDFAPAGQYAVDHWNATAAKAGATPAMKLNKSGLVHLRQREAEHGRDGVLRAIGNLAASPWHVGKNSEGWRACLGWLLKNPNKFQEMLERSAVPAIPAACDTERIKALEGKISLYERLGRDTELPPLRRELATLKAKVEGIAA